MLRPFICVAVDLPPLIVCMYIHVCVCVCVLMCWWVGVAVGVFVCVRLSLCHEVTRFILSVKNSCLKSVIT